MKELKKLLQNIMVVALIVAITIPNGFYVFADGQVEEQAITKDTVTIEGASYTDGTFSGLGQGRNGDILVNVTIDNGKISNIEAEQQETSTFWEKAKALIDNIKNMGNPSANDIDGVDTVTGATLSSKGIKAAMKDALLKALANEAIFAEGAGTVESPYMIANEIQLQNFAKSVNNGEDYANKYIKLSKNMDESGIEWTPIGSEEHSFGGSFDGNGKRVENISVGQSNKFTIAKEAGFFGKLSDGASIKNLTISNAKIYIVGEPDSTPYGACLIAVSGKNNLIDRCTVVNSEVFVKSDSQKFVYAAGLTGKLDQNSAITNSSADCDVKGESGNTVYSGAIAALTANKTLVMNNYTEGSVESEVISGGKATATAVGGGITAMASGVTYNCYADNTVRTTNNTTTEKTNKGSLVAWSTANGCVLNSCYNSGKNDAEPVIVFPSGGTFFEGLVDIKEKTTEETVEILHNNLSSNNTETAKKIIKEKAPAKDFGFEENLVGRIFYDWKKLNSNATISQDIWKEKINPQNIFASGTGTEEDPYTLGTEEQLRKFAVSLSNENTYAGKFIRLVNDINVSDNKWIPIGEGEYSFCGNLDGGSHVIEGISINGENDNAYNTEKDVYFGCFGVIGKDGTVKNLGVTNVNINVSGKKSIVVGGICGLNDQGMIDSCFVTGKLKGQTTEKGNNYAGGIAGWAIKGYIVNSYANASVYSSVLPTALAMPGGITGMTNRTVITNCYSLGNITGHTERKLEVVESMAAVGGLVGVAGSPVVNCYTSGGTVSEDYSYYVGAAIGWATGIAEIYDVYYNSEAVQTIQNQKVSPVSDIGWQVKQGINEDGEVYTGALTYHVEAKNSEKIKSQELADQLNKNFEAFPLNNDTLPANIKLKKWTIKNGIVTFADEYAERNFVEPPVEKPVLTGNYNDGTFYGRAESGKEYINVIIEVKNKKITSIDSSLKNAEINLVIESILKSNQAPEIDTKDSTEVTNFKNALRRATVKALKGDYTNYAAANHEIFAGGDGSKENPYKISSAEQLVKFAAAVNEVEHFKGKYIILTTDIDLSGIQWIPAGGSGLYAFSGDFDGKGYKISNMKIGNENKAAKYACAGLFAYIDTATIRNLEVKDGYINIEPASIPGVEKERSYAGLIAGYVGLTSTSGTRGGVIDNCRVTGRIFSNSVEQNYVGGIAGLMAHSFISNSYSDCQIQAKSPGNWVYAGGLVGLPSFSVIVNNYAYGKIYTDGAVNKTQLGGIGGMYSSYAFNNYTDVTLNAEKQTPDIGGIAGRNTGVGYIDNCYGNSAAEQKTGNKLATGTNVVGTLVSGDRYGKGQIQNSKLVASIDQNFVDSLNQNIGLIQKDKMYIDLIGEWFIYVPENLKFNTWTIKDGKAVFGTAQNNNNGNSSSSGRNSSKSSGGSSTANNNDNAASYKVKVTASQGSAKADIKVSDIKESKNLQIESSVANIVFDEKALKTILSEAKSEIATKINTIEKSSLSKEIQTIVGDRPVYDITLTSGQKTISNFGSGTVSVEIPYTLRQGENPNGIMVYYMDETGKLTKMSTTYNKDTKKVTFKTNHFSKYIVGYDNSVVQEGTIGSHFIDVSGNAWYENAVQYTIKNGIMNGVSDTRFDPDSNTTRAMVCTIFWNVEKKPTIEGNSKFTDVKNNSWYASAVIWSAENEVAKGVRENIFAPDAKVTREQFAQFLYAYAKHKGYNVTKTKGLSGYKDKPSAWAEEAVKWAVENQIISGKGNGILDPQGTATRAEIAQMMMKFNEKISM
ncbi:S-layer homology domain-containing protein [Aminipila sp.]|uniref:S-layer homology domain-containing protein n=1 Tax=Aminipila sp. TaxID=2060095 RepID=UPI00289A2422|nr:S-layer homology domain-containing protein [Aminipila sp.]